MAERKIDVTEYIINFEMGILDDEDTIILFQELIDTGMAWTLQGHYGRTAQMLIDEGYCTNPKDALEPDAIAFDEAEADKYEERLVKCSLCGDIWHTSGNVGDAEGCTACDDVFEIQPEDIVTQEEYEAKIEEETK